MNTFHSLVPVILVQLICQVRCVDHRRGIHKLPSRLHKLPGLLPPYYPNSTFDNHYLPPYNPFLSNPFAMSPYQMPLMFQSPFVSPYGFMPYMQPAFPFSKFSNQYQPPTSSEYPAEEPAEDFSALNSESSYMTQSSPLSYMTPYQQYNYFTPSLPSYSASNPQSVITPTILSYTPTTTQSASVTAINQTTTTAPSSQPAAQLQSPQAYVNPFASSQALSPANQTSVVPIQQQVLPGNHSADNSTVASAIITTENATQINSTLSLLTPANQSPTDLPPNAAFSNPPQAAADETPLISSNGETSTDMNSLPPQVKEFIDMIPNILAMPDSQAMAQMQQPADGRPRPLPFSLLKSPKKVLGLLHKQKLLHLPSSFYPPSYPAPLYHSSSY